MIAWEKCVGFLGSESYCCLFCLQCGSYECKLRWFNKKYPENPAPLVKSDAEIDDKGLIENLFPKGIGPENEP